MGVGTHMIAGVRAFLTFTPDRSSPSYPDNSALCRDPARLCGLHHTRYRGKPKTFPQHTLTAMALNLVRVDAWLTGVATTGSWTSRLARLAQPLPAA
jgi:hypothetical protein